MEKTEQKALSIRENGNMPVSFNFFDPKQFETMQRVCKMFASSELVPDMYKASADNPIEKAMSNCMIAIEVAQRIGASPLMIMQNMVPIYGRPAWSSKFLIATVNTCGRFNPLKFKFENLGKLGKVEHTEYEWNNQARKKVPVKKTFDGTNVDNLQCIAYTTARGSDEVLESAPITIKLAVEEGWYTKNGSKWVTMTQQMLMYRAASFWTNAYAPELSMGMKTQEEIMDIEYEDMTLEKSKETIAKNANKEEVVFDEPNGKEEKEAEKSEKKPESSNQKGQESTSKEQKSAGQQAKIGPDF